MISGEFPEGGEVKAEEEYEVMRGQMEAKDGRKGWGGLCR